MNPLKLLVCSIAAAGLLLAYSVTPSLAQGSRTKEAADKPVPAVVATLNAQALHALIASQVPMAVLDARGVAQGHIPTAKPLKPDADERDVNRTLAHKNMLVVTYCGGPQCPMSQQLADRLAKDGYRNVIVFPGGVEQWTAAGYELKGGDGSTSKPEGSQSKPPRRDDGSGSKNQGSGSR